jgi:hypothetical protein
MRALARQAAAAWRTLRELIGRKREASPTRDQELRAAFHREQQRRETELQRHPRRNKP